MPDVFVYATPKAYEQLNARLEEVSNVLGHHLGPALNKPPKNIIVRMVPVSALPNAANVHFEVNKTDINLPDDQRYAMQENCIVALQGAWLVIQERGHVEDVKKVDGTATISRGTWGKIWQEDA